MQVAIHLHEAITASNLWWAIRQWIHSWALYTLLVTLWKLAMPKIITLTIRRGISKARLVTGVKLWQVSCTNMCGWITSFLRRANTCWAFWFYFVWYLTWHLKRSEPHHLSKVRKWKFFFSFVSEEWNKIKFVNLLSQVGTSW